MHLCWCDFSPLPAGVTSLSLSFSLLLAFSLPLGQSLALSKQLIRRVEREQLHAVNDAEVDLLIERWTSDECFNAVMNFFQTRAKL